MDKHSFGNEYLYAEDLLSKGEYRSVQVQIESVIEPGTLKSADGNPIKKRVLRFTGKKKMLVLCKTNESLLHFICGDGPASWPGREINVAVREVEAFGDLVVAIRIMPPPGIKIRKGLLKRLGKEPTRA